VSVEPDPLQRIVHLEEVFSHQEQLFQHLNQVILELRGELQELKQKYNEQTSQVQWLVENLPSERRALEDEQPPHY